MDKNIEDYKVIVTRTEDFVDEVKGAIEEGWQPLGGVNCNESRVTWIQAMVRYGPTPHVASSDLSGEPSELMLKGALQRLDATQKNEDQRQARIDQVGANIASFIQVMKKLEIPAEHYFLTYERTSLGWGDSEEKQFGHLPYKGWPLLLEPPPYYPLGVTVDGQIRDRWVDKEKVGTSFDYCSGNVLDLRLDKLPAWEIAIAALIRIHQAPQ